jgi:hypothetical protein
MDGGRSGRHRVGYPRRRDSTPARQSHVPCRIPELGAHSTDPARVLRRRSIRHGGGESAAQRLGGEYHRYPRDGPTRQSVPSAVERSANRRPGRGGLRLRGRDGVLRRSSSAAWHIGCARQSKRGRRGVVPEHRGPRSWTQMGGLPPLSPDLDSVESSDYALPSAKSCRICRRIRSRASAPISVSARRSSRTPWSARA